jgi:hypothetical protein
MKLFAVVLLLFVVTTLVSCQQTYLPFFNSPVSNSPHATFKAIGENFAQRIQQYVNQSNTLNNRLIPWLNAPGNRDIFNDMVLANQKAFPEYYNEIAGLSAGSGVSLETLLLLNLEPEIDAIIDHDKPMARQSDTSCSDIYLRNSTSKTNILGHNEDADADIKDYAYMIHVKYSTYQFVAYCYPGYLPGNTFGFTSNGLVITTNAEFPKENKKNGIARAFLNRHFYSAQTPEEALGMAQAFIPVLSTGFALNVASVRNLSSIYNAEVAPEAMAIRHIPDNSYYGHFNQYDYLKVEEHYDPSSQHRAKRYEAMAPVRSESDIYTILGDTQDQDYPIYREGNPPDTDVKTVATAVFDLTARTLLVYTSNPKTEPKVQLQFEMDQFVN